MRKVMIKNLIKIILQPSYTLNIYIFLCLFADYIHLNFFGTITNFFFKVMGFTRRFASRLDSDNPLPNPEVSKAGNRS